jgi:23S rRNA (cytidine2498-2'-O)-methyltransferase
LLRISQDPPVQAAWAADIWFDAEHIPVTSIGHAARELKARERSLALYEHVLRGRGWFVVDKLSYVSSKPLEVDQLAPDAPPGSWTLRTKDLALAATRCSSPFNSHPQLVGDRVGPPSRAHLTLWEASPGSAGSPSPASSASTSAPRWAAGVLLEESCCASHRASTS